MVGDPDRLQQVVWNLANNAIKFTPKGGAVDVALRREGTEVELVVSDTGEGIAAGLPAARLRAFPSGGGQHDSPPRRSRAWASRSSGTWSKRTAARSTLRVKAQDRAPPSRCRLPVQAVFAEQVADSDEVVESEPAFTPRPANLKGIVALVVDDEADARDLVATVLRSKGAEVVTAATGAEALALIASRPFAVMVSDIGMPNSDGYGLIAKVRTATGVRGLHLPALALTAYSREEDRRRVLESGFQAYASKPVEPDLLVDLVDRLTANARQTAEETPASRVTRADVLKKLEKILATRGVQEALRFLNSRTSHRFTGVYRFDTPHLRNVALLDADLPSVTRGDDVPLEATYCSLVGSFERPFATDDAGVDERLRQHPARDSVRSYCGVLLRASDGAAFGTLCHFDLIPCDVPVQEITLMEAAARLIMDAVERMGDERE